MSDNNFPYSNEQIAEVFGTTQLNIRQHKSRHGKELTRNIDYVTNSHTNYKIFWSKCGVIKLADYVGSPEAKKFISQWADSTTSREQENREISQQQVIQPGLGSLPENQLIGLMEMTIAAIKNHSQKLNQLETRIEEVASQKSMLNVIQVRTAKDFKTIKKLKFDEIGSEINGLIQDKFIQQDLGHRTQEEKVYIYSQAHREARRCYYELTGITYIGAKKASFESKREFLEWLKKVKV